MYKIQFIVKELQDSQGSLELQVVNGQVRQARQVHKHLFLRILNWDISFNKCITLYFFVKVHPDNQGNPELQVVNGQVSQTNICL